MAMISAFTFIHNALAGGYPIREAIKAVVPYVDEVVVVNCQSDDGTSALLTKLSADYPVRIIPGEWGSEAGVTLAKAHALNAECYGDVILHFEADEVYDDLLVQQIMALVNENVIDIAVYRLQLEQNFQRCRWYPEPVHRVFPRGSVAKVGHTTNRHMNAVILPTNYGYLWDCTNCFRDCWMGRIRQQAELWNELQIPRGIPLHMSQNVIIDSVDEFLAQEHWRWHTTPFNIPAVLRPLVGMVKYE